MINIKFSFTTFLRVLLSGLWMLILISHPTGACWSSNHQSDETEFSLKTQNKPLQEILDQLGYLAGYSIEISPKWEKIPVTISTGTVRFEEGLKTILSSIGIKSFALIWDDSEKKLNIFVVDAEVANKLRRSAAQISKVAGGQAQDSASSKGEVEINPPPPEVLNAQHDIGSIAQEDKTLISVPQSKLLNEIQDEKPDSDDGTTIAPPSEQLVNRYHGETVSLNLGTIQPPSEKIIRQYQGGEFVNGEKKIPPPPREILMRR